MINIDEIIIRKNIVTHLSLVMLVFQNSYLLPQYSLLQPYSSGEISDKWHLT